MELQQLKNERLLRLPEVQTRTGYKRASIYAKMKDGTFPKCIHLGERSVGWLESEIEQWITDRVSASRQSVNSQR